MSAPKALVSIREFARLDGCSDKLVRNAIKRGKLTVSEDNKLDSALAGTAWRRQNRKAPESADKGADTPKKSAPPKKVSAPDADLANAPVEDLLEMGDEDFVAGILAGRFSGLVAAERIKENALAAKRLLELRREAGDVVDIEVAEAVLFDQARMIRDAWLNWPSRVGPLIAAELGIAADPVVEALNTHVQQQLTDLGEPDAAWAGSEG